MQKIEVPKPHSFPYRAMTLRDRSTVLPERNICSLYPATKWDDALVTGNGRQRLSILGDPYNETLAFTRETLYEPAWAKTPEPPDFTQVMPSIRKLLRENKFLEAAELAEKTRLSDDSYAPWREQGETSIYPISPLSHHHAFHLNVMQPQADNTRSYARWLDMTTGCVTVTWEDDRGTFKREAMVSYRDDVNMLRFTCDSAEGIDAVFSLLSPKQHFVNEYDMGLKAPDKCTQTLTVDESLIVFELAYCPDYGRKGYCSVLRLIPTGGTVAKTDAGYTVSGAESIVLLAKTVKYEEAFAFGCSEGLIRDMREFSGSFDDALCFNRAYLGERMNLSRIRLGNRDDFALSAEELLQRTHSEQELDPTLLEKLYDRGRFHLITETGEIPPFWGQHNINTNLQVCAGNSTGLFEEMDVYFRYYETKFEDFRTNARKLFGARGLLASVHCDYDSGLYYHFSKNYPHYCWTGCLGWIYNELWGYYLITGDLDFLSQRIVPALKEIALFFEDYACDRDSSGHSMFYPSFSPENPTPSYALKGGVYATSINSVMDIMICREVLDNLMHACRILGIEEENLPRWQAQRDALPVYLLDEEGGLKEWAWPTVSENYNHRHVSHHYDLWPGHYVTWEDQPLLARAIQISNRRRAHQDDSAHGIIHRLLSAIRLKDTDEAVQNLSILMNHGFLTRALTTYHFPYWLPCPDLQGAMPAVLLEMCVFSSPGTIELLPSLPPSLTSGCVEGIWLYTQAKLESLAWDERGFKAEIVSGQKQSVTLRFRKAVSSFKINGTETVLDGDHCVLALEKDERIQVSAAY